MKVTYQYQFYPDTNQKLTLNQWLRICRYWYNRQLGDRFDWWERNRTAINACPLVASISAPRARPNYYTQKQQLPVIKKDLVKVFHSGELLDLKQVDSTVLQDVSNRMSSPTHNWFGFVVIEDTFLGKGTLGIVTGVIFVVSAGGA